MSDYNLRDGIYYVIDKMFNDYEENKLEDKIEKRIEKIRNYISDEQRELYDEARLITSVISYINHEIEQTELDIEILEKEKNKLKKLKGIEPDLLMKIILIEMPSMLFKGSLLVGTSIFIINLLTKVVIPFNAAMLILITLTSGIIATSYVISEKYKNKLTEKINLINKITEESLNQNKEKRKIEKILLKEYKELVLKFKEIAPTYINESDEINILIRYNNYYIEQELNKIRKRKK